MGGRRRLRLLGASGDVDVTGAEAAYEAAMPGVDVSYVGSAVRREGDADARFAACAASFAYELLRASELWSASMDRGDVDLRDSAGTERYRIQCAAWRGIALRIGVHERTGTVGIARCGRSLAGDAASRRGVACGHGRVYPVTIDSGLLVEQRHDAFQRRAGLLPLRVHAGNNTFCAQTICRPVGTTARTARSSWFDIAAAIPSNATVSSAVFKAYAPPATPHIAMGTACTPITSDWDSTATWN